jgi:hypothetical protein
MSVVIARRAIVTRNGALGADFIKMNASGRAPVLKGNDRKGQGWKVNLQPARGGAMPLAPIVRPLPTAQLGVPFKVSSRHADVRIAAKTPPQKCDKAY